MGSGKEEIEEGVKIYEEGFQTSLGMFPSYEKRKEVYDLFSNIIVYDQPKVE